MSTEYEAARSAAQKCATRTEFCRRYSSLYQLSRRSGWLDDFLPRYNRRKPLKVKTKPPVTVYLARCEPVLFDGGSPVYVLGSTSEPLSDRLATITEITGQRFSAMRQITCSSVAARAVLRACSVLGHKPHEMVFEGRTVPESVVTLSPDHAQRVTDVMGAFHNV